MPMLPYLAQVARSARRGAELRQIDIASRAGLSHASVSRFETGQGWPKDPDRLIEAYAREADVDVRELWRAALEAWLS